MLVQVGAGAFLLHQEHRDGLAHGEARNDDIAEGHIAHSQHAGSLPVHGLLGGLADEAHVEAPKYWENVGRSCSRRALWEIRKIKL